MKGVLTNKRVLKENKRIGGKSISRYFIEIKNEQKGKWNVSKEIARKAEDFFDCRCSFEHDRIYRLLLNYFKHQLSEYKATLKEIEDFLYNAWRNANKKIMNEEDETIIDIQKDSHHVYSFFLSKIMFECASFIASINPGYEEIVKEYGGGLMDHKEQENAL